MKKLIKLDIDESYKINKKIVNFLNPEYVCVLLEDFFNANSLKNIKKYTLLNNDHDTFSTISGEVVGTVKIYSKNKLTKALFVKNDFKENEEKIKVEKINYKTQFLELFKNTKYLKIFSKPFKNIVINSIHDEPLVKTQTHILKTESNNIIETINNLSSLFNVSKNIIAIKNTENENINEYLSKTGSYQNLSVVTLDDLYLISREEYLLPKLNLEKKDTIILTPSDIMEIRHFLKYNHFKSDKYITVVNTINKEIKMLKVKKNCLACEVINKLKVLSDNCMYIKNGIMAGREININKEIISEDFEALFIAENKKIISKDCINCGKCYEVCPSKKCINCNLCYYVCPSNLKKKGAIK